MVGFFSLDVFGRTALVLVPWLTSIAGRTQVLKCSRKRSATVTTSSVIVQVGILVISFATTTAAAAAAATSKLLGGDDRDDETAKVAMAAAKVTLGLRQST